MFCCHHFLNSGNSFFKLRFWFFCLLQNLRLQKVSSHISAIHELSVVMSLDFKKIMAKIHPSFVDIVVGQSKSISNEVLARLTSEMNSLKQEKQQRLLQVTPF